MSYNNHFSKCLLKETKPTSNYIFSVLDDGRSSSLDIHPQNITLPLLSPPLSGNLTLQRHLRVFQDSGLLNFTAINKEASGLTVMKSDEFLRRFSVLNHLQSDEGKSLKSLARKLGMGTKLPSKLSANSQLYGKFKFGNQLFVLFH